MTDIPSLSAWRRASIALGIALAASLSACGGGGEADPSGPPDMKALNTTPGAEPEAGETSRSVVVQVSTAAERRP